MVCPGRGPALDSGRTPAAVSLPESRPPAPVPTKKPDPWHVFTSMRHSLAGFAEAFRHEPAFREGMAFVLLLLPVAIILPVNAVSTAVMIGSLLLIIVTELLNSAIEWTIDDISPEKRPLGKRVKDMASAAVFLAFVNCLIVWGVILYANWDRIRTLEFVRWPPVWLP